jgi:alpha-glucosidase
VLAFDRPAGASTAGAGTAVAGTAGGDAASTATGATVRCVANLSAVPVGLPPHASVLLASAPLDGGLLPPDTTAWLLPE